MHPLSCPSCGGATKVRAETPGEGQVLACRSRVCASNECERPLSSVEITLDRYLEMCSALYRLNQLRAWLNNPNAQVD
jgi:hypothetical protein